MDGGSLGTASHANHSRFGDFGGVRPQLAAGVFGGIRDHQRMRERPRLAGEVADVADRDAYFLAHLAVDAILDRLSRLDEARERAVHPGRKPRRAREEQLAAARDEHHHRRRDARVGDIAARRAFLGALTLLVSRRRPASATVTMGAVPFHDLKGAGGDREQGLRQPEEQRAQAGISPPGGLRSVRGEGNRDTRDPGEIAEVMGVAADAEPFQRRRIGQGRRIVGAADQDLVVAKGERERVRRQRARRGVTRREAFGRVHGAARVRAGAVVHAVATPP